MLSPGGDKMAFEKFFQDLGLVGKKVNKEGNVLFNPFYLQLYGVGHMVKDHSDI